MFGVFVGVLFKVKIHKHLTTRNLARGQGGRTRQCLECACLFVCVSARLSVGTTDGCKEVNEQLAIERRTDMTSTGTRRDGRDGDGQLGRRSDGQSANGLSLPCSMLARFPFC
uniref:Secreted protein n=1 Tax=Setaria digitata TaxID=48799 RepID=A0A915PXW0_9BILA